MSTVIATSVLPDSTANDTLTIGATGDSVAISGDSLNLNTLQDAGGNSIFVSDGSGTITSSIFPGAIKFISSQTASGSASLSFTSGLDSTYDVYVFKFIDINPATDGTNFSFQVNADGQSGFNETMTTSAFRAYHNENDGSSGLGYSSGEDQAQGSAYQVLSYYQSNDADSNCSGELYLFAPSSTTYVKHFYCTTNFMEEASGDLRTRNMFTAGYINVTAAIDEASFKMSSGNFDGTITLYGISKS